MRDIVRPQTYLTISLENLENMLDIHLTRLRNEIVYDYTHYAVDIENIEYMLKMVDYIDNIFKQRMQ